MNTNPWTPSDIEYLKSQRALGVTFSRIGADLNRSREAVAGKASRVNAPSGGYNNARKPLKFPPPRNFIPTPDFNPDSRNLPLADLLPAQCRYPHGDGTSLSPFFFCAADTSSYPYCNFHNRIAYRKPW